jgi:hypothetical protein
MLDLRVGLREILLRSHMFKVNVELALSRLCNHSTSLGLYVDHLAGVTIQELAHISSRSEEWVRERIEAARLSLKQVRIDVTEPCPERVWAQQVWD